MVTRKTYVLLLAGMALGVFVWSQCQTACRAPIVYRIGHVDARFGLSDSAMREVLQQAERLWESALGRNLFEYTPTATLTVNLVFDERQHATHVKQRLLPRLQQTEASHATLAQSYATWRTIYQDKIKAYDATRTAYDAHVQAYNTQVQQWNMQGGAPPQVQTTLAAERARLEASKTQLTADQAEVGDIVNTLKSLEGRGKALVETYTRQVRSYNALYGQDRHFHKGEYNGKDITIYQFHDTSDLILVVAHEFGHALGLAHVEDPKAVMHELLIEQDLDTLTLTSMDVQALETACGRE